MDTAAGALRIVGIHPDVPFTPSMQRRRDGTVRSALVLAGRKPPAVLVGDFNTTTWSPVLRDAEQTLPVRRARLEWGSTGSL